MIASKSEIIAHLKSKVVAAHYALDDGRVEFLS
jgi:hypothetical protein